MQLIEKDQGKIVIKTPSGQIEEYLILANFPFSSESKRMGIVLKSVKHKMIMFYMKGAEMVMKNKIKPQQRAVIDESCDNLAK